MTKPIVANNRPVKVNLNGGEEYHFCVCGRSANQPFCDDSHQGTGFTPKAFKADKNSEEYLCACKHTQNAPFCDGTHQQFSTSDVSKEGPGVQKE